MKPKDVDLPCLDRGTALLSIYATEVGMFASLLVDHAKRDGDRQGDRRPCWLNTSHPIRLFCRLGIEIEIL